MKFYKSILARAILLSLISISIGHTFDLTVNEVNLSRHLLNKKLSQSQGYVELTESLSIPQEFSLKIQLKNLSSQSVDVNIEIKDSLSTDYWTRLNSYQTLKPGSQELLISPGPVGESVRPGRVINFSNIKSIILAKVDPKNTSEIEVLNISQVKSQSLFQKGILAFDFENEDGEIFPGFLKATPDLTYSKEQGYGFENSQFWRPYRNAGSTQFPDSLLGDSLYSNQGKFKISSLNPNTSYSIYLGHKMYSGYWGEFPIVGDRNIKINDQTIYRQKTDRHLTAENYFKNQDIPIHEKSGFYETYIEKNSDYLKIKGVKPILSQIEISWNGHDCLSYTCFDQALTFLVAVPEKPEFSDFEKWLKNQRHKVFDLRFQEQPNYFDFLSEDFVQVKDNNQTVFHFRNQKQMVSYNYIPKNRTQKIKIKAEIPELKRNLEVFLIQKGFRRTDAGSSKYSLADTYYVPFPKEGIDAAEISNVHFAVWLENIEPTEKIRLAHLKTSFIQGKVTTSHQAKLNLINFALPDPDILIGPFNSNIQESWWPEVDLTFRSNILRKNSIQLIKKVGLSTFTFFPDIEYELLPNGKIEIRNQKITDNMAIAKSAGFKTVYGYNRILVGADPCYGDWTDQQVNSITSELKKIAKKENWLPLNLIICDEPISDQIAMAEKNLKLWSKYQDNQFQFSTAFSSHSEYSNLFKISNSPVLNQFNLDEVARSKKPWIFYNDVNRFTFGGFLFFLKNRSNLIGRLGWNWNNSAGDPYVSLDAREDDINWCTANLRGELRCHSTFYNEILKGVNDYRIILGLDKICKNTKPNIDCQKFFTELEKLSKNYLQEMKLSQRSPSKYFKMAESISNQATLLLVKLIEATNTSPSNK